MRDPISLVFAVLFLTGFAVRGSFDAVLPPQAQPWLTGFVIAGHVLLAGVALLSVRRAKKRLRESEARLAESIRGAEAAYARAMRAIARPLN